MWDACIRIQDSCHGDQTDGETTVDFTECFWQGKVVLFLFVFSLPPSFYHLSPLPRCVFSPIFLPFATSLPPLLPSLHFPSPPSSNLYAIIPLQQSNLNVEQMLWQSKAGWKSLSAEWELNYPAWLSCWHIHIERKRARAQVSSELNQPFCLSISHPGSQ